MKLACALLSRCGHLEIHLPLVLGCDTSVLLADESLHAVPGGVALLAVLGIGLGGLFARLA